VLLSEGPLDDYTEVTDSSLENWQWSQCSSGFCRGMYPVGQKHLRGL